MPNFIKSSKNQIFSILKKLSGIVRKCNIWLEIGHLGPEKHSKTMKHPYMTFWTQFEGIEKNCHFWPKSAPPKFSKSIFCWPIISGQYCDMWGRYIPSGPPRLYNMEVIPLLLLSYIWCWNSGLRLEKQLFSDFVVFVAFVAFLGTTMLLFEKYGSSAFSGTKNH